jgi:hypothetical protein
VVARLLSDAIRSRRGTDGRGERNAANLPPARATDSRDRPCWALQRLHLEPSLSDFSTASLASSRGFPEAIVSFANTNVLVDAGDITDPRSVVAVREIAERKGFATATYQLIASINIDPAKSEGGFAGAAGFVYMGNYSQWSRPLTGAEWVNVANAVYHHEVAHHWGWPGSHDWARQCRVEPSYQPFIVPPVLFGWEDVDGDRIAEILDSTPYGRH